MFPIARGKFLFNTKSMAIKGDFNMKHKIGLLTIASLMLLASCGGTTGGDTTSPSSGEPSSGTSSQPSSSSTVETLDNTASNVYSLFYEAKKSQNFTVEYQDSDDVNQVDYYTENYIFYSGYNMGIKLDTSAANASRKMAYYYYLENDGNVSLGLPITTTDSSGNVSSYTSLKQLNYLTNTSTSIRRQSFVEDKEGNVYVAESNTSLPLALAYLAGYTSSDASSITGAAFYILDGNDIEVTLLSTDSSGDQTEEKTFLITNIGRTADPDYDEVLNSTLLSNDALTEDILSPFSGKSSTLASSVDIVYTDSGELYEHVGDIEITRNNDEEFNFTQRTTIQDYDYESTSYYYKGTDNKAYLQYLSASNEVLDSETGYTWAYTYASANEILSSYASYFRKTGDGVYSFYGTTPSYVSYALLEQSFTSSYGSLKSIDVEVENNQASAIIFNYQNLVTTKGDYVNYIITVTPETTKSIVKPQAAPEVTDSTDNRVKAVNALNGSGSYSVSVTSDVESLLGTLDYYIDADTKSEVQVSTYSSSAYYTGYKQETDSDDKTVLRSFYADVEAVEGTEDEFSSTVTTSHPDYSETFQELIWNISPALLVDKGDYYVINENYETPLDLTYSFSGGNMVSDMIPATLKFNHDKDGLITSITYDYYYAYSSTVYSGTETMEITYGKDNFTNEVNSILTTLSSGLNKFVSGWDLYDSEVSQYIDTNFEEEGLYEYIPYFDITECRGKWEYGGAASSYMIYYAPISTYDSDTLYNYLVNFEKVCNGLGFNYASAYSSSSMSFFINSSLGVYVAVGVSELTDGTVVMVYYLGLTN